MAIRIDSSKQSAISENIDTHSTSEKNRAEFSHILSQTTKLNSKELEDFLLKLDLQGKKLSESLSVTDLHDFKNMVKKFLQSTFGQSRTMQEESYWDFRGQPKVMARVTKINQALEDLGRQILSSQAEPLRVLEKIGEIRGLIVDLFA
ncbi:protein of unknown function DUF327 [Syntrophobotulus glycolicus DSM 8271]|uniref:DUF327 domain-containing protein n=1 Tax=Syntrophobotulus glycolicus (strain DSM 8271 / FlGlyR) TaxID=645991 RepID=F0SX68_SYNGF|nr:YaaR family protein [Syntrophobotulus glycolicus]ADY56928.1 protein of unknown function DUF327 [Syntrophobotulus glycolicus DSM 8271]